MQLEPTKKISPKSLKPTLSLEEQEFAHIIADLVEQWGFKRHLGRVWSLLYLHSQPLNPTQIQDILGLSSGNTNSVLHELLNWGVIKRVRIPNDRKYYYAVDEHIWRSVTNVFKARELRILSEAISHMSLLKGKIEKKGKSEKDKYQIQQIEHVKDTLDVAYKVAHTAVSAGPENLEKISKLLKKLRLL